MGEPQQKLLFWFIDFNALFNRQLRLVGHIEQRDVLQFEVIQLFEETLIGIVPENDAMFGEFCFKAGNKFLILQGHNPMLILYIRRCLNAWKPCSAF